MSELSQAIEQMRNMRESYNQIGAAAEAYNTGKAQLAQNIASKGVPAAATETLPELAAKVNAITQESYTIDGGEMYAKQLFGSLETPNYWNLYEVLTQLLSDGRLVNYGGILLAEYYKGYDSLALEGAGAGGAYVVSDKDSDGNFIMYTADTTHVWDTALDGKGNRWVAYCFADEYHNFQITDTNISPRSIFIGRKVGTITSLVNGRTSKIVTPDGSVLRCFNTDTYTQNFGQETVFRNISGTLTGNLLFNALNVEKFYFESSDGISGGTLCSFTQYGATLNTVIVVSPTINGTLLINSSPQSPIPISTIIIKCNSGSVNITPTTQNNVNITPIKTLSLLDIDSLVVNFLVYSDNYAPRNLKIFAGYSQSMAEGSRNRLVLGSVSLNSGFKFVQDLELQDGWCKNLDARYLPALTEANIYTYILQRLKQDEAGCGDGVTITLGATNLAKLTSQESQDLLASLRGTYGYTFA